MMGSDVADCARASCTIRSDPAMILHDAYAEIAQGFSSRLACTHYRALRTVADPAPRAFYEIEVERQN